MADEDSKKIDSPDLSNKEPVDKSVASQLNSEPTGADQPVSFSKEQLMQEMSSLSIPNQYDQILKQIEQGIQNSEKVMAENLMKSAQLMNDAKNTLNAAKLDNFSATPTGANTTPNETMQSAFQSIASSQQQITESLVKANEHLNQVDLANLAPDGNLVANAHLMMNINEHIQDAENNVSNSVYNMNSVIDSQLQEQHQEISKKQQVLQGILNQTQPQTEVNSNTESPSAESVDPNASNT
ncbi:hypothetical protein [Sessilibacter sp. MAH4]